MKTRNGKQVLVFLLLFALLASMLSGTVVLAAEEGTDYRPAEAFTEGMDCLVVAEAGGAKYALAYDGEAITAQPVTETDGVITLSDKAAVWTARPDDTIESAGTPGAFIFSGSYGLMIFTGGRTFEYDAEARHILMHKMYYLTFDAATGKFDQSIEEADAADITLYEPVPLFTKTDALVDGDQFVIVTEAEGKNVAFSFDGEAIISKPVNVTGDTIRDPEAASVWYGRPDDTLESAGTPGSFIFSGSYGLMIFTGGRTFEYNAETKHILMHKMYYLTYDASTGRFDQSLEEADAASFTLYGRVMPKTEAEEKYIPDGSDLPCVERASVKNADGSITLAFVTDIHYSTQYAQNNLQVWFDNVSEKVGYIDALGSLGDMGSAYSATPEEYWTNLQAVFDYMDGNVENGAIGNTIYTFGNHEWYPAAGGDFMNNYEVPAAKRLFRLGEAIKTDDYIFYCLGAGSIASKYSQGYSDEDIARVDAYLSTAPTDIPIFVLTHFPVHFWGDRKEENADKLLDVFNKYPNLVVLWGHNHSDFDESYDMVYRPGDTIVIDQNGTSREINFTYLSAGCISDVEYTGAYGGSAWVLAKGLIVTIKPDGTLVYDYYDMDGNVMHEDGPYLVEFRDGVEYQTLKREYVQPGAAAEAPEVPRFEHYTFKGWDTAFDKVDRHLVVTAQYDYETLRDENYVYLTVTLGPDALVGRSGKEIILYPVPFTENMTVGDAFSALQEAEYPGGEIPEISAGSRGFFTNIWGLDEGDGVYALAMNSNDGYVASSDAALAGNCYYLNLFNEDNEQLTASYVNPEEITVGVSETVTMAARTWVGQPSHTFMQVPMDGDVYVGNSWSELADSGVKAVDGVFELSFKERGDYFVAVKAEGAANAYAVVHVGYSFVDVEPDAYYHDAVEWAVDNAVTSGIDKTHFGPDKSCTRAQFVTFLWRAAGKPQPELTECPFTDVAKDTYYYDAVLWAVENGITYGKTPTAFAPEDNVTRGQAVTFLWRYKGEPAATGACAFTDVEEDAYYYSAVLWAAETGATNGKTATAFCPEDACIRGQIVAFLWRALK